MRLRKRKRRGQGEVLVDNPNSSVGQTFNSRVEIDSTNETGQKTNKKGKTKTKNKFKEESKHTDLDTGEVSTMSTRQTDKYKSRPGRRGRHRGRHRQVFEVRDKDGKLLVKQVDRGRSGKKQRTRLRVTRRGRKAGYGRG